jgi:hypothetical protein
VNRGPRSILLDSYYHLLFTCIIYIFANYYLYYTICLILCLQKTNEIDNLTVKWGKVLGCVVCRFHIATGAKLRPRQGAIYKLSGAVAKPASINLRKLVLSPTGSRNLGFILREDLLLCSSYLPLGVPNWAVIYTPSSNFSGVIAWEKEDFCKGSLSLPIFLLCYCFALLYFACIFLSKIQKISSFYSWFFVTFTFSLLCCFLSTL